MVLHEHVVMPNHMHGIIEIKNKPITALGIGHVQAQQTTRAKKIPQPGSGSIPVIIQQYKSTLKRWCNKNERNYFQWQSRFHDRVIRSIEEYVRIAEYIDNNSSKWPEDKFFV